MLIIKVLSLICLVISCVGWWFDRDYGPALAAIGSLSTFIGVWVVERSRDASQSQSVGVKGIGIQAGRDANVGDISKKDRG